MSLIEWKVSFCLAGGESCDSLHLGPPPPYAWKLNVDAVWSDSLNVGRDGLFVIQLCLLWVLASNAFKCISLLRSLRLKLLRKGFVFAPRG